MGLPDYIVKQFVQITNDSDSSKEEPIIYGTIEEHNETKYVRIDGSSEITPVTFTVAAKAGDRVTLSIKNHTATVTGNLTDPSASGKELAEATITINGMEIKMRGFVTFEGLSGGTTTIDGACIKTGTIDAARLNLKDYPTQESLIQQLASYPTNQSLANALSKYPSNEALKNGTTTISGACIQTGLIDAAFLNLSGAISFSDLSTSMQNDFSDMEDEIYGYRDDDGEYVPGLTDIIDDWGYTYKGTTYIDGEMIMTGTVMASELIGGTVTLLTKDEDEAGSLVINDADTGDYAVNLYSDAAMRVIAEDGALYLASEEWGSDRDAFLTLDAMDGSISFGDKYMTVYVNGAEVETSDLNEKKDIEYGLKTYDSLFDDLRPVSFRFKENTSGRRHIGLIAQDVEQALIDNDISTSDFAVLVKRPKKDDNKNVIDGEFDYGLRYGELITLCIEQIQSLKARVAELENQNGIQ